MKRQLLLLTVLTTFVSVYISCSKILPKSLRDDEVLDGPIDGLTAEQNRMFLRGNAAFDEIFNQAKGLGPLFVNNSCASCHAGDGKGHPFTTLTRFGQNDTSGNKFLQQGAPQLQHRSIIGFQAEQIPLGATFSNFTPPANTGLGFFEAVADETILALADEKDADRDGISGRPNWTPIPSYLILRSGTIKRNGKYVGRFGKKASIFDLLQQTVNAYNQDMGINSSYEHYSTYTSQEADAEVSNQTVQDLVFYLQSLKAPIQRNQEDGDVRAGKQLFLDISCGKCHKAEMKTGNFPIAALSNKTFFPFTDMLIHDMGPGLDDGYTEGTALTSEWRTPALWGLGLSQNSQGSQLFLMHDGRAHSIEQAIEFHGGETQQSKQSFQKLNDNQKAQLIKFLKSL